jgi:hypothetical protein
MLLLMHIIPTSFLVERGLQIYTYDMPNKESLTKSPAANSDGKVYTYIIFYLRLHYLAQYCASYSIRYRLT